MKKILARILAVAITATTLFSSFACEAIEEIGILPGGGGNSSSSGKVPQPEMNDDPTDDFVVNVTVNGKPFPILNGAVIWRDAYTSDVYSAPLDENGQARIDGLDGDYYVSLTNVTYGYAYDPNAYIATNDEKTVNLEVWPIIKAFDSINSSGFYNWQSISRAGVYTATLRSSSDKIYFNYSPEEPGEFSVESWVNIAEDFINPTLDSFTGNPHAAYPGKTVTDGGKVGSYTNNFKHTVQMDDSNFSSGGGQASFMFALYAESRNEKYPITFTFALKRDGDFDYDDLDNFGDPIGPIEMVIPTFDFSNYNAADHEHTGQYKTLDEPIDPNNPNARYFGAKQCELWKKENGGDGFYHLYDKEKYPMTNGYGPIIYAFVKERVPKFNDFSVAFNKMEYLSITDNGDGTFDMEPSRDVLRLGKYNYKLFIEGYAWLARYGRMMQGAEIGSYYCSANCICHDLREEGAEIHWACDEGCEECDPSCRQVPANEKNVKGYADYANSQGLVPVTEELKTFLTRYCKEKGYCNDGSNLLQAGSAYYDAVGDSLWMFACCYYED